MPAPTDPGDFTAGTTAAAAAVNTRFQRLYSALSSGQIDAVQLAAAAQPNNGVWRTIAQAHAFITGSAGTAIVTAANPYMYSDDPSAQFASGGATYATMTIPFFPILAADLAVTGLTTKVRVKFSLASNATAVGTTLVSWLAPMTIAGPATNITPNYGTTVATATLTTPSASVITTALSSEVALPADGGYALMFQANGSPAANFAGIINTIVQVRNV